MDIREAKRKREQFLLTLYELAVGEANRDVNTKQLAERMEIDYDNEASKIGRYLREEELISWGTFAWIAMTPKGRSEAERIMVETYRSKERRVLQKLYDERERKYTNPHQPDELAHELGLELRETQDIVVELERKGLTEGNDQATWIVAAGMEVIESGGQQAGAAGISFTTNIHGPNYGGIQQGGQGNTQTNVVVGSDFEQAMRRLLAGIEQSASLSSLQKIRAKGDIQTLNELALMKKTSEVVTEAETRVTAIQSVLSTTADLVSLGMVVIPIIRACFGL
jgi:hypothetical protein